MPRIITDPADALLVIDVQPTFMPGGGLPVAHGNEIVTAVRRLIPLFPRERRTATKDWHPFGHICLASSYVDTPPMTFLTRGAILLTPRQLKSHARFTRQDLEGYLRKVGGQMLWPDHGIQGTSEAGLHPSISEAEFGLVLRKGTDPRCDSYSAFRDNLGRPTGLADELRKRGVRRVFLCGLALDYCVGRSAEDAVREGFETFVAMDATRPVGFPEGSVDKMFAAFHEKGIFMIQSTDLVVR